MARTISEIKKTMTDAFMADADIREMYGFRQGETFDEAFSSVSLESILFYIVAACCRTLEAMWEYHRNVVEDRIARAVVASVPWYHKMALAFQYGDNMVFDESTMQFRYASDNPAARVIRYAAVRDRGTSIQVLVSGEKNGLPEPLSNDILTAFKSYMNRVKIAGVILSVRSLPADDLHIYAEVMVDPLVINASGVRADGTRPVEEAIKSYLKGIIYGGTFNKTKLVDAIQQVEGVSDVVLGECRYKTAMTADYTIIEGNNYTAQGGSFTVSGMENTIYYVVQN